jgi:hypothetical protein
MKSVQFRCLLGSSFRACLSFITFQYLCLLSNFEIQSQIELALSRFTGGACGHEGKLIVLIIAILWKGDQPIDL